MGQILEQFGEEFTITGKRLGWYIGQWKKNGGWTVMLKSIDKIDFVFCTLIPKTNGEFDPFSGVLEQTWYASLQGQIMEVCADGITFSTVESFHQMSMYYWKNIRSYGSWLMKKYSISNGRKVLFVMREFFIGMGVGFMFLAAFAACVLLGGVIL